MYNYVIYIGLPLIIWSIHAILILNISGYNYTFSKYLYLDYHEFSTERK